VEHIFQGARKPIELPHDYSRLREAGQAYGAILVDPNGRLMPIPQTGGGNRLLLPATQMRVKTAMWLGRNPIEVQHDVLSCIPPPTSMSDAIHIH
jgi:hypothetical protein